MCFTVLPSLLSCISLLPALCFLCRMDVSRQVGGQTPACPPSWELREKQLGSVWPRTLSGENQAGKIKVLLLGHGTGILKNFHVAVFRVVDSSASWTWEGAFTVC